MSSFHLNSLRKWSLMDETQFECVTTDLDQVVEQRAEARQRVGGAEERDVSELDEHLQIVVERSLVLRSRTLHLHLTHLTGSGGSLFFIIAIRLFMILRCVTDRSFRFTCGRTESSEQIKTHLCKF